MKSYLALAIHLIWVTSASAITIDTVPVGDAGNPNDPATGNLYGGVNYAYSIGKYEVTIGQYTAFLNAVAATDTYSLYNTLMASNLNIAGIQRSGASGSYTYSLYGSPNHPIAYVSWGDAARFANWLHNGQPTGSQNATTTEDGAYVLNGAVSEGTLSAVVRKPGAKWFIPSESEWYKAAYYQPGSMGGDSDGYWAYPMRTNNVPYSAVVPGTTAPDQSRTGNFFDDDSVANGYNDGFAATGSTSFSSLQNYLTDVGAYESSSSFYGTFDQGGNVNELNEALFVTRSGSFRGVRGGDWTDPSANMLASARGSTGTTFGSIGFRVATLVVPEPSTILLAVVACASLATRRRKSIPHNHV
jgi:sulfatase modifying factor 1